MTRIDWDSDEGNEFDNDRYNKRSPDKTRPTSEERKINRPTAKHYFTLDRQEKKRGKQNKKASKLKNNL